MELNCQECGHTFVSKSEFTRVKCHECGSKIRKVPHGNMGNNHNRGKRK